MLRGICFSLRVLAILLLGLPSLRAVDFVYVSLSDDTITRYDVTSGVPATIEATKTVFTSGFSAFGMVFDGAGNLYASDATNNQVKKIDPTGLNVSTYATSLPSPRGLAFDSSGSLYVSNNLSSGYVSRIAPGGGTGSVSTFASGISRPVGLTFDSSGNLVVASYSTNFVKKVTPTAVISNFASVTGPFDTVYDSSGNLFVSSFSDHKIYKVDPSGTKTEFWSLPLSGVEGLTIDGSGNLYSANLSGRSVSKIAPNGTTQFTFSTGIEAPRFIIYQQGVPEPSTYALSVVAAGAVALIARNRKHILV